MESKLKQFIQMLKECNNIVFFGGAGVSTESGIKDYRSKDGLYSTVNEYGVSPETILSRSFFFQHTDIFYDFYRKYFISDVYPNEAHYSLAKLERIGKLRAVITQNIDGLHQSAGSRNVVELHGTSSEFYCSSCNKSGTTKNVIKEITSGIIPRCIFCGKPMKPKVVLYEEPLYNGTAELAVDYISAADMLIIGGTSLAIYPAAAFVNYFKGKYIVMINKSETDFDQNANLVINESIGKVLKEATKELVNTL